MPPSGQCCDGENVESSESCPDSCDVMLVFCDLTHMLPCPEGFLGYNYNANIIHHFNETGEVGLTGAGLINPLTYNDSTVRYYEYPIS